MATQREVEAREYMAIEGLSVADLVEKVAALTADIVQAFSPDGCACIKDIPGDNYTCTAHQRLRKIALDAAKEAHE
jgi:hypothetical protein